MQDLTAVVAVGILISGLDDLFVDLCYYGSELYRAVFRGRYPSVTEEQLSAEPEQAIAVMIPAWQEHAVIAQMLRNTIRTVDYENFDIFVGTYPNDEATMLAVAAVAELEPRVHRIVCPHEGPTNKADCLNWIIEGIRHYDKTTGKGIKIIMLHDSEDMVHPLSFKLMNHLIPRVPMVQIPVVPFESDYGDFTAGTYLDEFAESHLKDMVVRERLSGMVPSAGVGTGFSRDAIEELAVVHKGQIFNVCTFTEDYDLAFRLKAIGKRSILLQHFVERTQVVRTGWPFHRERLKRVRELVGTREYFPSKFKDAVRQKARWTLGIVFHGWQQRGWEGNLALRYMVWRDRKTLATNSVNMLGYLLLAEAAADAIMGRHSTAGLFPLHIAAGSWVWSVVYADSLLLTNRCLQRLATLRRITSWPQALLSIPRIIWGNVVNFFAVAKATRLFLCAKFSGQKLVWAKTAHAFPTEAQLLGYKRKLGDLLLDSRMVTLAHLNEALNAQKERRRLLGDILVDLGYVSEADVVATLAKQLKAEAWTIDPDKLDPEAMDHISEEACREHLMIVVDVQAHPLVVAAADVLDARMRKWLDANLGCPYRLVLSGRRSIVDAIDRLKRGRGPIASVIQLPLARQAGIDQLQ